MTWNFSILYSQNFFSSWILLYLVEFQYFYPWVDLFDHLFVAIVFLFVCLKLSLGELVFLLHWNLLEKVKLEGSKRGGSQGYHQVMLFY